MLLGWLYVEHYVLTEEFLLVLLCIWGKKNPNVRVNVYGFLIQSSYIPWLLFLIRLFMNPDADLLKPLIGIAVGYLYIFLKITLPNTYGIRLLETP